ncbi:MAG: DNA polymerase III subunit delta [Candidatus Aminicenantales bacterium]
MEINTLREESLLPGYFFYGEETYPAIQFIKQLKERLITKDAEEYGVEKFWLEESSWAEIIDLARTLPIFFMPKQIIHVEVSGEVEFTLSAGEERILREYFDSPSSKSVIVVICPRKLRKGNSLLKFFSSLPRNVVQVKELKRLRNKALYAWMEKMFAERGKRVEKEALQRLEEISGDNLSRLEREIEKLSVFVGEKKFVELDDVNQLSGWGKICMDYELFNSLEEGDFRKSLSVLNSLFREGNKPEYIFGIMARFFRDILVAKLWLKEKKGDRKEIFRKLRPQIQETFGSFYRTKFSDFFRLVESLPLSVLEHFLSELERIDVSLKSSDASARILLERFLFGYCRYRKERKLFRG